MPKKIIEDKEEDIALLDLRDIKPDTLLEIVDVVSKEEAINLDMEVTTAGYDLLGDDENEL